MFILIGCWNNLHVNLGKLTIEVNLYFPGAVLIRFNCCIVYKLQTLSCITKTSYSRD